jgi:tetratricopeptide (TPR) repeat protein
MGKGGIVRADVVKSISTCMLVATVTLTPVSAAASPYRVFVQPAPAAAPSEAAASDGPLTSDPAVEYQKGEQAYALGNYEQAVRHFERSYELSNLPDLLYNLGMSYAQWHGLSTDVNHLRKAKRLFQNYLKRLAENPAMDQSQRAEAEAQIARVDEQITAAEKAEVKPVPPPKVEPKDEPKTTPSVDQPAKKPVYKRGWFWGLIGGIVVVGAVTATAIVLTRKSGFEPELGTIGPSSAGVHF